MKRSTDTTARVALAGVPGRSLVVLACLALVCCDDGPATHTDPDSTDVLDAIDAVHDGDLVPDATPDTADNGDTADLHGDADADGPLPSLPGTAVILDLDADLAAPERFFDLPFPNDLRVTPDGAPDFSGLPHPASVALIDGFIAQAAERPGFGAMPVVYFRFDGPVATGDLDRVIPADGESSVVLVDLSSAATGTLTPTVAHVLPTDAYTPANVLAVAPRPGFVLDPSTTYAVIVRRSFGDAAGAPLGVPAHVRTPLAGGPVDGAHADALAAQAAQVAAAAARLGVELDEIAAFTVFTTGDPASELLRLAADVVEAHDAALTGFRVATDGTTHERFCQLEAVVEMPQFQAGTPPYSNGGGDFVVGPDGALATQRLDRFTVTITLPRAPMPDEGYPVVLYLHGSGGLSTQVVDRGPVVEPGGPRLPGLGPAHVLAARGFATIGTALPINPERVPGASDISYIIANPLAFRDNIRQGAIEQRLLLEALGSIEIPAAVVAACDDDAISGGAVRLDGRHRLVMGQSQGGHYANVVAAVDPTVDVVVPTGAGGFMTRIVLTQTGGSLRPILAAILESTSELDFTHPAMSLLQTAWEPVEPLLYMACLHDRPLPGRGALGLYAPVAEGDSFYSTAIYDGVALAYRSPLAGTPTWPSLLGALELVGLGDVAALPLRGNTFDTRGTAAIVQFEGDELADPHGIFAQLDAVKFQYGCFFRSFVDDGIATLYAPASIDAPCE
jgi:hypothetical protein